MITPSPDPSEVHLTTAAALLKARTADAHRRVESCLGLAAPTSERVGFAVGRLHDFYAANEPAIEAWFAAHPVQASELDWPRRSRLATLLADRDQLAIAPVAGHAAPTVFASVDEADVLGWLYVAEGSTLGGAVIDRLLRDAGVAPRPSTFTPYAEGPAPMWRAYLAYLHRWADGQDVRAALVADAGVAVFAALERWVDVDAGVAHSPGAAA